MLLLKMLLLLLNLLLLNVLLLNMLLLLLLSDGLLFQIEARDPRERERFRRVKVPADHNLRRIRRLIDRDLLIVNTVVNLCSRYFEDLHLANRY